MQGLDEDELSRRRPVWSALSDLFLDTEVRDGLPHAAVTLLASGYADVELEAIFLGEVAPILHWNLKQVAGEWGAFDQRWLADEIVARRSPTPRPRQLGRFARWLQRVRAWPALHELEVLLVLVNRARALPVEERASWATALGALVALYFERPSMDAFVELHVRKLEAARLERERVEALVARDLFPVFELLRVRGIDPSRATARAQVQAAIERLH